MFKSKKLILPAAVATALVGAVLFARSFYVLPILMYHSVDLTVPRGNVLTVSLDTFEKQMAFLKKNNYSVLALESLEDYISGKKKAPARSVVLTFDDGNQDNYTYAFPVLKKYGFPATIFIIVSEVGLPGRLTWEQIKKMQDSGLISFGSHTMSHCFLDSKRHKEELEPEIIGSKQELEEKLGREVKVFSYPMGRFTPLCIETVSKAGYRVAVATNPGGRYSSRNILALKRLRISENARNMFIFWFESNGYYNIVREIRQRRKK